MNISFFVGIVDGVHNFSWPEEGLVLLDENLYKFRVQTSRELLYVLGLVRERSVRAMVSSIFDFSASEVDCIDFFEFGSNKYVSLKVNAWEANFEAVDQLHLMDKGGWAPVSIPRDLAYATSLKAPRDIAHLMDACAELVVSATFLEKLREVDGELYGEPLFTGKMKKSIAEGVFQLAVDRFALPAVRTGAVGTVKGVYRNDVPGAENIHLGVPVLPAAMSGIDAGFMRSAEPWSGDLVPGWIVPKRMAPRVAALSKQVCLWPVLLEGSPLYEQHERVWRETREIVDSFENVNWGSRWSTMDLAPVLRRARKPR